MMLRPDACSNQHFLPNLLPTDEEDSDEGDDADAIAEVLLGRKPLLSHHPNGHNSIRSGAHQRVLEEGQVCEDEASTQRLNKSSQEVYAGQTPATSLLDRLGPPSSVRRSHKEQVDPLLPPTVAASIQSPDPKSHRLLPDDSKLLAEGRTPRGQKRPLSPRRRRNNSRSKSPIRHRHSPPACDARRRASLSARITLNNRRNSCSPDSTRLDLSSRSKRIPRRFSSPSNSAQYRRDPRDREILNLSRYPSDARRSRHADLHPPCKLVIEEPNSIPISNVGSISKSPSLNSPDLSNIAPPKVSVLVANLPSYYVLTPKRLFEHLTDPVFRQKCQSGIPYELKLYRYSRSDCTVGELKFNSLDDARQFTHKADRSWPPSWYTTKKPPQSRQKNVELTILEDKQISWPSNYETYFPKMRSNSLDCPTIRVAEDCGVASGQPPQAQVDKPSHVASAVDAPASRPVKDLGAPLTKITSKPDYYRPKPRRTSQEANVSVEERKTQSSLQSHSNKSRPILHSASTPANGSRSPSSLALMDPHVSLAKVKLGTDDVSLPGKQLCSAQTPTRKYEQQDNQASTSGIVLVPMSHPASDTNMLSPLGVHSVTQKCPENADSEQADPLSITEKNETEKSSVLLSNLHPSLTWPVLQSHFSFPNRPRHFRIFQPFQVAYGSFFLTDPTKSSFDGPTGPQEGCMISFNDANTARNFCRVLQQNPPFQSVETRLVDATDIEFVPSASIIRNPHDQDFVESSSVNDPANLFIQNSLLDFHNQMNWTPLMHPEMPVPMDINPHVSIPETPFNHSNFTMQQPDLSCSVYPYSYNDEYNSDILGYAQSHSTVPMHYPYNAPDHNVQTFSSPMNHSAGFNTTLNVTIDQAPDNDGLNTKPNISIEKTSATDGLNPTPNVTIDQTPDAQQALQDRLKKILKERKAKSSQSFESCP